MAHLFGILPSFAIFSHRRDRRTSAETCPRHKASARAPSSRLPERRATRAKQSAPLRKWLQTYVCLHFGQQNVRREVVGLSDTSRPTFAVQLMVTAASSQLPLPAGLQLVAGLATLPETSANPSATWTASWKYTLVQSALEVTVNQID